MQYHILGIVRFVICLLSMIGGIVVMAKTDSHIFRIMAAGGAALTIWYNEDIGRMTYLLIGSTLEALIASCGVVFVVSLLVVLAALPIIIVVGSFIKP